MNKSEHRHQLIRALVSKNKIHTQAELQALLAENDIQVTQATLSRDIKTMNLSKVREEDNSYYVLNTGSISKWEKRLATLCGDDVCMIICEDAAKAQACFESLKKYAPPFFFSE